MTVNSLALATVVATLNPLHIRAIGELDTYWGRGPRDLASNLGISLSEARDIFRNLRREGVVEYGFLMCEDEGLMRGKGYWLSTFGMAVRDALNKMIVKPELQKAQHC